MLRRNFNTADPFSVCFSFLLIKANQFSDSTFRGQAPEPASRARLDAWHKFSRHLPIRSHRPLQQGVQQCGHEHREGSAPIPNPTKPRVSRERRNSCQVRYDNFYYLLGKENFHENWSFDDNTECYETCIPFLTSQSPVCLLVKTHCFFTAWIFIW